MGCFLTKKIKDKSLPLWSHRSAGYRKLTKGDMLNALLMSKIYYILYLLFMDFPADSTIATPFNTAWSYTDAMYSACISIVDSFHPCFSALMSSAESILSCHTFWPHARPLWSAAQRGQRQPKPEAFPCQTKTHQ